MRISPVSNYNQKRIAFGKFSDANAKNTLYNTLVTQKGRIFRYEPDHIGFKLMDDMELVDIFTASDGKIHAQFNDEGVITYAQRVKLSELETEYLDFQIEILKRDNCLKKYMKNLKKHDNAHVLGNYLKHIYSIPQFSPSEDISEWKSFSRIDREISEVLEEQHRNSYAMRRAEEEAYH